ncbi:MAG: DUF1415 domain-containing protein [Bacteroidota bacterium]
MKDTIQITQAWIADFVIRYNLCPFAKKPFVQQQIRYVAFEGTNLNELVPLLQRELVALATNENAGIDTSFLILENVLMDFNDYLDFLEIANDLIFALRLEGVVQLASFHPQYQFADTTVNEVTNFTNRSPLPMLHLLKESSIEETLKHYETPEKIPERNQRVMRELAKKGILVGSGSEQ